MNPNRLIPRHIIIKMAKLKENFKGKEKTKGSCSKRTPTELSAECSTDVLQARSEWHNIFKVLKVGHFQPRTLYPARLLFRIGEEIKFSENQNLKNFINI